MSRLVKAGKLAKAKKSGKSVPQWSSQTLLASRSLAAILDQFLALRALDVTAINHELLTSRDSVATMRTGQRRVVGTGELSSSGHVDVFTGYR